MTDRGLMLEFLSRREARENALDRCVCFYMIDVYLGNQGRAGSEPLQRSWDRARQDALRDVDERRCDPAPVPIRVPAIVVDRGLIRDRAREVRAEGQRNLQRSPRHQTEVANLAEEVGLLVTDSADATRAPVLAERPIGDHKCRVVDVTPAHLREATHADANRNGDDWS